MGSPVPSGSSTMGVLFVPTWYGLKASWTSPFVITAIMSNVIGCRVTPRGAAPHQTSSGSCPRLTGHLHTPLRSVGALPIDEDSFDHCDLLRAHAEHASRLCAIGLWQRVPRRAPTPACQGCVPLDATEAVQAFRVEGDGNL